MRPVLDRLRDVCKGIEALNHVKRDMVQEAVSKGITWQELCWVSKYDAAHLCAKTEGLTVRESMKRVTTYMEG